MQRYSRRALHLEPLEERTLLTFAAPRSYIVGDAPAATATADFNFDGLYDLATANSSGTVSVLLGTSSWAWPDGSFGTPTHYPTGRGTNSILAVDLNGDYVIDLATADSVTNTVSVLYGYGDGTFLGAVGFPAGVMPYSVAAGDFNADGLLDLVAVNVGQGTLSVLFNNGDRTYAAPQTITVGGDPRTVVVADFDQNGFADLAVTKQGAHTVGVLLGNGDGTFQPLPDTPTQRYPTAATVADFNHDSIPDVAVSTIDGATVLLGVGDGRFIREDAPFWGRYYLTAIAAGDFNADGNLDLAVGGADGDARAIYGGLSIQLGNGDGTFGETYLEDATVFATHLLAQDFNWDGIADLAVASYLRICDDECSTLANSLLVLAGRGDGDWQRARVLNGGRNPNAVAVGDFNGDRLTDLVTASFNGVGVQLSNGDGSFVAGPFATLPRVPFSLAVGDFNGDGRADVATTNPGTFPSYTNGLVHVLLSTGAGGLQLTFSLATKTNASYVAAGDVNGDGVLDLVVLNRSGQSNSAATVTILLGNGDGTFTQGNTYETGRGFGTVHLADLNGDGLADIAAAVSGSPTAATGGVFVLLSNGDGTFQPPTRYDLGGTAQAVQSGDWNNDGIVDLVASVSRVVDPGVSVLLGDGDGTFQPGLFTSVPRGAGSLAVGDFNWDGWLDLAATSLTNSAVVALLGTGTGSFRAPTNYSVRQAPREVAVADFNSDGWLDLAAASGGTWPSYGDGGINLLFNDYNWFAGPGTGPGTGPGSASLPDLSLALEYALSPKRKQGKQP